MKGRIGKKLALAIGGLLLALLLLELGAVAAYWIRRGEPPSRTEIRQRLLAAPPPEGPGGPRGQQTAPLHVSNKILHPYLGFVLGPGIATANSFGFSGPEPPFERSEGTLNVAIFGGSVALDLAGQGYPALLQELSEAHPGRVRIACFAVDGYKQPQALISLAFMLSLGARLDVAINLDGFNEIALPITENVPSRVFPFYPRSWDLFAATGFQPEVASRTMGIADSRRTRAFLKRLFSLPLLRESTFMLVLWDSLDRFKQGQETRLDLEIRRLLARGNSANPAMGPFDPAMGESEVLLASARVWREASLQMDALCRSNGIRYYHFLQPNQYVAGSKPFTEEESRIAFGEQRFRSAVERAYPMLLREGDRLREKGVRFFDLTSVFQEVEETLYRDACCHVNLRGNQILGRAIGRLIREEWASERPDGGF